MWLEAGILSWQPGIVLHLGKLTTEKKDQKDHRSVSLMRNKGSQGIL